MALSGSVHRRARILVTKSQKTSISVDICVDVATIHQNLVIVSFSKRLGSQRAFYDFFNTVVNDPSCNAIVEGASKPIEITSSRTCYSAPVSPVATRR